MEDEEVGIVVQRVAELGRALALPEVPSALKEIRRVVTVFRGSRGRGDRGRIWPKSPSGTMSPARSIGHHQRHGAGGALRRRRAPVVTWWPATIGAIVKDPNVLTPRGPSTWRRSSRERRDWADFYRAAGEVSG